MKKISLRFVPVFILMVVSVDLAASRGGKVRSSTATSSWSSWLGVGKKSKVEPQHKATMYEHHRLAEQSKQQLSSKKSGRAESRQVREQGVRDAHKNVEVPQKFEFVEQRSGYQPQSFSSYVKASAPAQYVYHLPGEMSVKIGGPRNVLYNKPEVQLGRKSPNPYIRNKQDSGYRDISLSSQVRSSAPAQYAYHLPGEMSVAMGGPRNLIYNRSTGKQMIDGVSNLLGRESTNPYLRNKRDSGYKDTSLLSSVKNSVPAQYVYHLPGELSIKAGGPRNIIYDRSLVQQGKDGISSLVGVESTNPYVINKETHGYEPRSLLSSVKNSSPAQYVYHLPGEMSARVGGPRNVLYDRATGQQFVAGASNLIGIESANPYTKQSRRSAKVTPSRLSEGSINSGVIPYESYLAVGREMYRSQDGVKRAAPVQSEVSAVPDSSFRDVGQALYEPGKAVAVKQVPSKKGRSLAEQEKMFLENRAAKQAAKDRGMTGNLNRFNVH